MTEAATGSAVIRRLGRELVDLVDLVRRRELGVALVDGPVTDDGLESAGPRAGKYLVVVDGDAGMADRARQLLAGTGAVEILTPAA